MSHIKSLIEAHGMTALIEGVEAQEQKDRLVNCGITLQQGFFLGKPEPLDYYVKKPLAIVANSGFLQASR